MVALLARTPSSPVLPGRCLDSSPRFIADRVSSGIGLETSILFAKEGASVLLSDISQPALEKAAAKVKQLVPNAPRVEIFVSLSLVLSIKPTPH